MELNTRYDICIYPQCSGYVSLHVPSRYNDNRSEKHSTPGNDHEPAIVHHELLGIEHCHSFQTRKHDLRTTVLAKSTSKVSQWRTRITLTWQDKVRAQNKVSSLSKDKKTTSRHGGHPAQKKSRQPPSHWQHTQNSGPPASSFCFAKNLAFSACSSCCCCCCCCFCGGMVVVVVVLPAAPAAAAMRRCWARSAQEIANKANILLLLLLLLLLLMLVLLVVLQSR